MGIFRSIDISGSGLSAERLRMDVISNNIANVNTTRSEDGGPFRRKLVIFQSRQPRTMFPQFANKFPQKVGNGVRAIRIMSDPAPFKLVYDPNHPDADEKGYIRTPNINVVHEMVDMITASRAYEANVTCINSAKEMVSSALAIGRR
ncbi:flagellar basal body rod protein FlgC [bacterium]|nr:flagellar basal body rod protein FlgC [bacterium]